MVVRFHLQSKNVVLGCLTQTQILLSRNIAHSWRGCHKIPLKRAKHRDAQMTSNIFHSTYPLLSLASFQDFIWQGTRRVLKMGLPGHVLLLCEETCKCFIQQSSHHLSTRPCRLSILNNNIYLVPQIDEQPFQTYNKDDASQMIRSASHVTSSKLETEDQPATSASLSVMCSIEIVFMTII